MNSNDILKEYNIKTICANKVISFFLFISVVIAISISLSIPQISGCIEKYWDKNAYSMNGADLKIEAIYPLEKFDEEINNLKKDINIRQSEIFNTTVEKNEKEVYGDLIVGEYPIKRNQTIISSNLAKTLDVIPGDNVYLGGKKYKIIEIEQFAEGVGKQAEEMGYIKVSSFDTGKEKPYSKLFFIDGNNYKAIEQKLKKIAEGYRYSTVAEVRERLNAENATNMMALNMLNTVGIIMTVLSVFSSIILIISKSRRDIAIMRLHSIKIKEIKKVFRRQFRFVIYPAILIGTLISVITASLLLQVNNLNFYLTADIVLKLFFGMLLFGVIYDMYIHIACSVISQIRPMNVLRGEHQKNDYKGLVIKAALFTLLILFVYSIYVGSNNIFAGSIIVLGLIIFFVTITFVLLRFILLFRPQNRLYKYTFNSIREKIHSILIIILSLSFTILFFLIGFTLSNVVATNYGRQLKENLNYNYMLTVDNVEKVEQVLKQTNDTGMYTKLNMRNGILLIDAKPKDKITLCGIEESDYYVKYNIMKGEDIFEGNRKHIVISDELAKTQKLDIGDTLSLECESSQFQYIIKGIYNSEHMNAGHILIDENELAADRQGIMYLAKITKTNVLKKLKGVQIVTLNNVSSALEEGLQNILGIFKSMCGICIVLSCIFNINLVYTDLLEQRKNYTVMRAIGIGKRQLIKSVLMKMAITLILTIFLSIGNYCVMMYYAMRFMFNTKNPVTVEMLLVPSAMSIFMIGLVFAVPIMEIKRMRDYSELRELV